MTSDSLRATVHTTLRRFASSFSGEITDELQLGSAGLGLDSISIVEFLMEVESRTGKETSTLLESPTLTVGQVIEHLGGAGGR